MNRGVLLPIHAYPLFENALRAANGWSLPEHAARIGGLWSRFSQVAAANPYAWIRQPRSAEEIITVTPENRMISFPYPKLCTANLQVDQGAGYIVCSVEAARAAGVPEERWVFPQSGADANDHWYISERPELHRSPAIRLAGAAALQLAGLDIDDVGLVDLYSCFPVVVQMAARELGLAVDDPDRPLTLTGGLTFAGGPGNNYTSHGIASAVAALRAAPGSPCAGQRSGLVRHQALARHLRDRATEPRRAVRLARPAGRGRCAAALCRRSGGHRHRAGRDLHGHLRPRRATRARHRRLPHRRRDAGLGQRDRGRGAGLTLCARGRGPPGDLSIDGTLTLRTERPAAKRPGVCPLSVTWSANVDAPVQKRAGVCGPAQLLVTANLKMPVPVPASAVVVDQHRPGPRAVQPTGHAVGG